MASLDKTPPMTRPRALLALATGSAATGLAIRVTAAGLGYVLQIGLARLLGAEQYGIFALAWVWLTIAGFAGCFGFSQIVVRFWPVYRDAGDAGRQVGFMHLAHRVVLGTSLLLAILIAGGAFIHARLQPGFDPGPLLLAALAVPIFSYQDFLEGHARAEGRIALALAPPYILRQGLILVIAGAVVALGVPASAEAAMACVLGAVIIAAAYQHRRIAALSPVPNVAPVFERRNWTRSAFTVFLADSAMMLRAYADVLIVSAFAPPAAVAVYFAATRVAALLGFVEYAVGAGAGHRFASLGVRSERQDLRAFVRRCIHMTFWPTLIGAAAITLAAPFVLLLFGPDFQAGASLVAILAVGYVVRALAGPADDLLNMLGLERLTFTIQSAGLVVNVALGLLLVPLYGIQGAAVAASASLGLTGLWLMAVVVRQLRAPTTGASG